MKKVFSFFAFLAVLWFVFARLFSSVALISNTIFKQPFAKSSAEIISDIIKHPFSVQFSLLIIGISFSFAFMIAVFISDSKAFNGGVLHGFKGKEQGSARFGKFKDIKPYIDLPNGVKHYYDADSNMIMTKTEGLSTNTRKTLRNNNILVVGGSGAGKTRFFVKPNLMQLHSSYVITDPKGEILRETGYMFEKNGYDIKVFNLIEPQYSAKYNPFRYIRNESDILNLVNVIMKSTSSKASSVSDQDFWEKAERALLMALFGYVHYELPEEDQSVATVMDLLAQMEQKDSGGYMSGPQETTVDMLFDKIPDDHFSKKQYKVFKLGGNTRTTSSILITAAVRLAPWNMKPIRWLMNEDTIDLPSVGRHKTAMFIIIPDSRQDFTFIAAMIYQQLFDMLYYEADYEFKGHLPYPVRFMLDEFPNIGQIPQFERYLATMRSRDISASIIVQNLAQLKSMYKDQGQDAWETIVGNCDSFLFLGGQEQSTLKYLSEKMGKTTIEVDGKNLSRGSNRSVSKDFKKQGRSLMDPDEIARMDNSECLYLLRGVYPFKSKKFDIKLHKHYSETAEVNEKTFLPSEMNERRFKMFFNK